MQHAWGENYKQYFGRKTLRKEKQLVRQRRTREHNIKIYLRKIMTQDGQQKRAVANAVKNPQVPQNVGNLTSLATVSFSRKTFLH
jgi:hypothetical protein